MKEFHEALEKNDVEAIKRIIKQVGPNYQISSKYNGDVRRPLLHHAVEAFWPRPDIAEVLFEAGADPNAHSDDNQDSLLTHFFWYVINISDRDWHVKDYEAILKTARLLIKHNIKPTTKDFEHLEKDLTSSKVVTDFPIDLPFFYRNMYIYSGTPFLNKLINLFFNPEIFRFKKIWFANSILPTARERATPTPAEQLVYSVIGGDTKTVEEILKSKKVDVNSMISNGYYTCPPLLHALRQWHKNVDMIELLLKCGADPNYALKLNALSNYVGLTNRSEQDSIMSCYLIYACKYIDSDNTEEQIKIIKIAKLLLLHGATQTKADLQYIEKNLIGHLITEKDVTVYVRGTKPFADCLIDLFNDPTIYNIKNVELNKEDLELYCASKETADRMCILEGFLMLRDAANVEKIDPDHMEDKWSASMPVDLISANSSLEKAILARDAKAISTDTIQPLNKKIEGNIKVADQLLKGIVKTKIKEAKYEEIAETINYFLPG